MAASPPTGPVVPERLVAAREALERHAWQEAFDGFTAADAELPLSGPDLEALAEAAFFTADVAFRSDGGWIVVEINDGGVSTLPEQLDPRELYRQVCR